MSEDPVATLELPYRPHVSSERRELHAWLHRRSPPLANLYSGALQLLYDSRMPARPRFVAHAVREIANRLPDALAGQEHVLGGPKRIRIQPTNHLDEIAKIWHRLPEREMAAALRSGEEVSASASLDSLAMPVAAYRKLDDLILQWSESRRTSPERMAELFMTLAPENKAAPEVLGPVIKQWSEITSYFVGVAHENLEDSVPEGELIERFKLFEQSLINLCGSFYPRLDQLDQILDRANA